MIRIHARAALARTALALGLAATAAACGGSPTEREEHLDAVGMVVLDANGAELASVRADRSVQGALTARVGTPTRVQIFFVDPAGQRFQVPVQGRTRLEISVVNPALARFDAQAQTHAELVGLAAGATRAVFTVQHGSHADYRSPEIPLTVAP